MAKFNNILNIGAGSLGNTYLRRTRTTTGKTVNVLAQKNFNPRNPRTSTQMVSRAKFATAVKFYKRATRNFFRFAFEDKKKNESDYNAFMRHNIAAAVAMNKAQVENEAFPAVGDRWMLSQGSLTPLSGGWDIYPEAIQLSSFYLFLVPYSYGDIHDDPGFGIDNTVSTVSDALIRGFGFKEGQIFTIVCVKSPSISAEMTGIPQWCVWQFVIDSTDKTSLDDVKKIGSIDGAQVYYEDDGNFYSFQIMFNKQNGKLKVPTWCAAIVTDKQSVPGKLLATTSYLEGNDIAKQLIASMRSDDYYNSMLTSWKADIDKAILQGSIANTK